MGMRTAMAVIMPMMGVIGMVVGVGVAGVRHALSLGACRAACPASPAATPGSATPAT
jgi:hypothetical protein